jgi:hypothetical protein
VGFGDCCLLSFAYPEGERHVLVDFGTAQLPRGLPRGHMLRVARDIERRCQGAPLAVVATHRHADHLSGFATDGPRQRGGRSTGEIIRDLGPRLVLRPWTEDPALPAPPAGPPAAPGRRALGSRGFALLLGELSALPAAALAEAGRLEAAARSTPFRRGVTRELRFVAKVNLSDPSAEEALRTMGRGGRARYLHAESRSGLEGMLPGVTVHVLGPPTVEQAAAARGRAGAPGFWDLRARLHQHWGLQAALLGGGGAGIGNPFPRAERFDPRALPPELRWFRHRVLLSRGEQLLEIVRALDRMVNDTSLVLLFEVGPLRLLFPGDAGSGSWTHALSGPEAEENAALLSGTDLYKVGHHGGQEATPPKLWDRLGRGGPRRSLRTLLSTLEGHHGNRDRQTEVPRRPLLATLRARSRLLATPALGQELARAAEVDLTRDPPRWRDWRAVAEGR